MASKSSHVQWNLKGFIKLGAVIAFLVVLTIIIFKIAIAPKDPVTVEQVSDILVEQGYEPQDITEQYSIQNPEADIIQCIAIEEKDIHFEFFTFLDESSARNAKGSFYSLIIRTKRGLPYVEHDTKIANYSIYTLASKGTYSVAIRVGATVVYAYCNEENAGKIGKILQEIDYFDK